MKISKVDNARFAVVETKGKLYYDPRARLTLQEHIDKRVNAAKKLYNVYNLTSLDKLVPNKIAKKDTRDVRGLLMEFNSMLKVLASMRNDDRRLTMLLEPSQIKLRSKSGERGIQWRQISFGKQSPEEWAEMITEACLRKGLRKQKVYLSALLSWFAQSETVYKQQVKQDQQKAKEFLEALVEDYEKNEQKRQIQNSLERQDVRVQVVQKDGEYLLALANYDHENAHLGKKAVFGLMREYAQDRNVLQEKLLQGYVLKFFGVEPEEWRVLSLEMILPAGLPVFTEGKKSGQIDLKEAQKQLQAWLLERYRRAAKDADKEEVFWYEIIQDFLEAYFSKRKNIAEEKLTYQALIRQVQGKLCHYLMGKYMDLGKAVYHFCDMDNADSSKVGQVLPQYTQQDNNGQLTGITSFDYEVVKAKETLEQDLAISLVYAGNHFGQIFQNISCDGDYLTLKKEEFVQIAEQVPDLLQMVLRFWGGASQWETEQIHAVDLAYEIQQNIYALRNSSFHYGTQSDKVLPQENLHILLGQEKQKYSQSVYRKYVNNNVFGFYPEQEVVQLIQQLHDHAKYTPSFVPAFGSVLKRKQMPELMKQLKITVQENGVQAEQLRSALYYAWKEIYYYDFLRDDSQILARFREAIRDEQKMLGKQTADLKERVKKNKNDKELRKQQDAMETRKKAMDNFIATVAVDDANITFAQICQRALMTYALQNNTTYRDAAKQKEMESFAHYKMILNKMTGKAFLQYVKEHYAFLTKPSVARKELDAEALLQKLDADVYLLREYDALFAGMEQNERLIAYYVLGKLLPPKQLNFLVGDLKNYQQFVEDIRKRSSYAGCNISAQEATDCRILAEIMQFCLLSNGQISNQFADYYTDKNDYADYLRNYVSFADSGYQQSYGDLELFCAEMSKDLGDNYRIYVDGQNPVLFSGIETARLYGMDQVLKQALQDKVSMTDIEKLQKLAQKDIPEVLKTGECNTAKEQKALKRYQEAKQKIELTELQSYSNLLYDCYAPLVNWCYIRERDTLYLLFGYYYMKQFWPLQDGPVYPMLKLINRVYQYGQELQFTLPVDIPAESAIRESWKRAKKNNLLTLQGDARISTRRKRMQSWFGEDVFGVEELMYGSKDRFAPYYAQSAAEREARYRKFRNDIDHFEYFRTQPVSLLQLYQTAYYYMGYDRKLQNTVITKLQNVLERYFMLVDIVWDETGLKLQTPKKDEQGQAILNTDDGQLIVSRQLMYTTKKEGTVLVSAHCKRFCKNVECLLQYHQIAEK